MKINEAVKILSDHNKWRRGKDDSIKMCNPTELGIAIDVILEELKNRKNTLGKLTKTKSNGKK